MLKDCNKQIYLPKCAFKRYIATGSWLSDATFVRQVRLQSFPMLRVFYIARYR